MKKENIKLISSNFQIKKTNFVEAIFEVEVTNIKKLEEFIEKHENGETNANISKMGRK
jgi:hypothetical protein